MIDLCLILVPDNCSIFVSFSKFHLLTSFDTSNCSTTFDKNSLHIYSELSNFKAHRRSERLESLDTSTGIENNGNVELVTTGDSPDR